MYRLELANTIVSQNSLASSISIYINKDKSTSSSDLQRISFVLKFGSGFVSESQGIPRQIGYFRKSETRNGTIQVFSYPFTLVRVIQTSIIPQIIIEVPFTVLVPTFGGNRRQTSLSSFTRTISSRFKQEPGSTSAVKSLLLRIRAGMLISLSAIIERGDLKSPAARISYSSLIQARRNETSPSSLSRFLNGSPPSTSQLYMP